MIIITFVMVCEMEWSYKIRYHRDFEYIPSSPPEPQNNSNQGWNSTIQHVYLGI